MSLKYEPASEPLHIYVIINPKASTRTGAEARGVGGGGPALPPGYEHPTHWEGRCKATWKRGFKLPWREADPPNHQDDQVDSDQ